MVRKIITIDREKCEGCGTCILECSKGAIKMIDGKATLVDSIICDAGGSCAAKCPMYAISFIETETTDFDSNAATNEILRKMLAGTPPAFPPSVFSGMNEICPCMKRGSLEKSYSEE